jgi:hypothetical protein
MSRTPILAERTELGTIIAENKSKKYYELL